MTRADVLYTILKTQGRDDCAIFRLMMLMCPSEFGLPDDGPIEGQCLNACYKCWTREAPKEVSDA